MTKTVEEQPAMTSATIGLSNTEVLTDEDIMHIYQTMHSLCYIELEELYPYTPEELAIEVV